MVTWDDSYALAEILMRKYPNTDLNSVSLRMIHQWIINLPDFDDELALANDEILEAIFQEWYEEANPV